MKKSKKYTKLFAVLIVFVLVVIVFIFLLIRMGHVKNNNASELSDLGGVYASDAGALDLKIEISGKLSGGGTANKADSSTITNSETKNKSGNGSSALQTIAGYDEKFRSWGISRKPDNQLPDADPGAPLLLKKYDGIYLGDTTKKIIYLTFDEGYENGYTPKILDVLKNNKAKAIFFITGPYLKDHQDLVRRMVEEGHSVGNHTIHHPSLPVLDDRQIEEEVLGLDRAFNEKFGKHMRFLRPPKGEYSERTLALTNSLGFRNMFWSFAYDDWYRDRIRGADYAYEIVMRNLHNGAVLLLHAVSRDNADALDMIIRGVREKGYEIGNPKDLE